MKKENKTVEGINTIRAIKKAVKQCKYRFPLLYGISGDCFKQKRRKEDHITSNES
jgi:glycerol-3-phosphate dehydrogenase